MQNASYNKNKMQVNIPIIMYIDNYIENINEGENNFKQIKNPRKQILKNYKKYYQQIPYNTKLL